MTERTLTCIGCPMGCPLHVTMNGDAIVSIEGYTCPRGKAYAEQEITHPLRSISTIIPITGAQDGSKMLPCRVKDPIPKEKIFDVMKAIKAVTAAAPVCIGDVLLKDAAGTGVDIIAAKDVL